MSKLDTFRKENPGYEDWSDGELADSLYNEFYSEGKPMEMPREKFDVQMGMKTPGFMDTAGDVLEQGGNRLVGGVLDIGGIFGDVNEAGGRLANWAGNRVAMNLGERTVPTKYDPEKRWTKGILPTSGELKEFTGYHERKATTPGGRTFNRYAGDIVEAIPGAVALGGGPGLALRGTVGQVARQTGSRIVRGAVVPVEAGKAAQAGVDYMTQPGKLDLLPDWMKEVVAPAAETVAAVLAHGVKRPLTRNVVAAGPSQAKTKIISDAIKNAEDRGIGKIRWSREASLREEFGNIIRDPRKFGQFSPEEQAMIRQTADGKILERVLMRLGEYSPESGSYKMFLPHAIGYFTGMPWLGSTITGSAIASKRITSVMTKRAAKATEAMVKEGKNRKVSAFPGVRPAVKVGVKFASQPQQQTWELIDDAKNVLARTTTKHGDFPGPVGVPKDLQGRKDLTWRLVDKPVREKVPLIPGGEPIVMTPSEAATAPEETPPLEEDTEDDPLAELRGDQ